MSWYDDFIPPEIQAGRKIYAGDWEGALEEELGRGGTYLRKSDEGKDEVRQGYATAIDALKGLGEQQRQFQMEGLERAENYYLPFQQRLNSIYGPPGSFRK